MKLKYFIFILSAIFMLQVITGCSSMKKERRLKSPCVGFNSKSCERYPVNTWLTK